MKKLEKTIRAFGNESRLKIIAYLKKRGIASVIEIAKRNKLSYKATSKHLGILYQADILDRTQSSFEMHYRISPMISNQAATILNLL